MQFKKLAALTGSAIMAGLALASPILAASVTSLGKVQEMVKVTDSTVDFPIFVIGERAASSDVAGAVDVAVRFAANAKTTTEVETTTTVETVTGGVKVETVGNKFTPWQAVGNIKNVLTSSDLSFLGDKVYQPVSGSSYTYKQYLYLAGEGPTLTCSASSCNTPHIEYSRPTGETTPRLSFKTPQTYTLYTYKLAFTTPVSLSGVTNTATLQAALSGTSISMMGKDFVISDATYSSGISDLTLLGGGTTTTVETGQDSTVTVGSKEYVVHLDSVAAESGAVYSAIGNVNGESFQLRAGQTKTLSDGINVGAIKVFAPIVAGQAGYASLTIGGDKYKLYASGTLVKGTQTVTGLTSTIASSSTSWSSVVISYAPDRDKFLNTGEKITDPFIAAFDLKFNSFEPAVGGTSRQTIGLTPSGSNMLLTYKNAAGNDETVYMLYMNSSTLAATNQLWGYAPTSASGSDNNFVDLVFDEASTVSAIDGDYFIVSYGGFSHVLRFSGYDAANSQLTFTDEKGGAMTVYNTSASGAQLIVDGNAFNINITDATNKKIQVDMNKDGKIAGSAGAGTQAGVEYGYLVPKLISSGQGGLYFLKKESTYVNTTSTNYPAIGIKGLRFYNTSAVPGSDSTETVALDEYVAGGTWSNVVNYTVADAATVGSGTTGQLSNYVDVALLCYDGNATGSAVIPTCKVGLGTSGGYTYPGLVLAEEAQQGSTAHHWIYIPVNYSELYLRTLVGTPISDDSNAVSGTSWAVAVIGTTGSYKGMDTYGTLVDFDTVAGTATLSYPDSFSYGNVYVLGPDAVISSTGGAGKITTETVLPLTADVVKLDSEIGSDKTEKDLVLLGGPCINTLTAEVMGKTFPACGADSDIPENAGLVKLFADKFATGKTVLLIAGWEAADTDLAARVVQLGFPGATDAQKAGTELTVTGTVSSPAYS